MTYNTGNQIGSVDDRDVQDNAANLDFAVNSLSPTFTDRFGFTRDTLEGIYQKSAYYRVGTFSAGYTLTNIRQTLEYNGLEYSWSGSFPKVVSAGSTPTPVAEGAWIDRSGDILRKELYATTRNQLSKSLNEAGYDLVSGSFEESGTVSNIDDTLWSQANGKAYSWGGVLPKTVSYGSTPEGTGGVGPGAWIDRAEITLKTSESVSLSNLPVAGSTKSGYLYDVNGQLVQSNGVDYGSNLDPIAKLNRHLGFLQQSQSRAYAEWSDQTVYSDLFADLSGWTGSSPTVMQVSGGAVFGNGAGANSGMCHGITAAVKKFRCVTTVNYISSANADGVAVGICDSSAGAAPSAGLANCFAIYLSQNGMKQILNGVITAHENTNPLTTGVYVITISQDDNYTSIVAKLAGGGANTEYAIRIPRGQLSANNIVIFNSDSRLLSGSSIGPLAVGVNSTATLQQTGIVDGQYHGVVWTGGTNADYRIATPVGYDSRKPKPAVLLFHGLGSTERSWASDVNYFAISNALLTAGFIVISAARRSEYGTWGNANAQAAYSEAYRYLVLNYNVSCIACLANSMGGIEFFNSLASGSIGVPTCFVGTSTTANLAACFASPTLTASIKSAYGIAADGSDYAAKTAGYDPILKGSKNFLGIPQLWLCATDDATVSTSLNRDLMVKLSAIDSSQITYVTGITGDHTFDITPYLPTITDFIYSYSA